MYYYFFFINLLRSAEKAPYKEFFYCSFNAITNRLLIFFETNHSCLYYQIYFHLLLLKFWFSSAFYWAKVYWIIWIIAKLLNMICKTNNWIKLVVKNSLRVQNGNDPFNTILNSFDKGSIKIKTVKCFIKNIQLFSLVMNDLGQKIKVKILK